jgi:branched-chain amino acid transport system permease protein
VTQFTRVKSRTIVWLPFLVLGLVQAFAFIIFRNSLGNLVLLEIQSAELFGIYLVIALSLNLEAGFTGVPNFGKVFFVGLGSFITGGLVAHAINWLTTQSSDICHYVAVGGRQTFAFNSPQVLGGLLIVALVVSAVVTGIFGYLLSFPALRLREDYLGILLIAAGEILRVFVRALPQNIIACESDTLNNILNPFTFLQQYAPPAGTKSLPPPFAWVTGPILSTGAYTVVVLAIAVVCYITVSRLSNSPYGRMLKSIRDDEPAAISLGKDPAKIRGQVMIIGSAMAGVGGALFAFYLSAISTEAFIPLFTFIIWAILLLGGAANNRGVVLGAVVYVSIYQFIAQGVSTLRLVNPSLNTLFTRAPLDLYFEQVALGAIIIIVILFRPQGILAEKPIKTPAWKVIDDGSTPEDKQPR